MNPVAIDAALDVAMEMLEEQGTLTTLELKDELRERYPEERWYQSDISQTLMTAEQTNPNIRYHDTGIYRVYALTNKKHGIPDAVDSVRPQKISRSEMVDRIKTADQVFTAIFDKQNGEERTICGTVHDPDEFMDNLGYINVYEINRNRIRKINPRTLKALFINQESFTV